MKPRLLSFAVLGLLVIFVSSCSKKSNLPIPADAAVVVRFNGASLQKKLSIAEIKSSAWYQMMMQEGTHDEYAKKILDNPELSGVDMNADAFVFIQVRSAGSYSAFTCAINDEKKFAEFVSNVHKGAAAQKSGDLSYVASNDVVVTWNGKRALILGSMDAAGKMNKYGANPMQPQTKYGTDSLLIFAKNTYDLSGSGSLGNDDRFASLMKEDGDIQMWFNGERLYGGNLPSVVALSKASTLLQGNVSCMNLTFEDGKIKVHSTGYVNKDLAALFKKYDRKNIDEDMLKMLPAGKVNGVLIMNYPPEGLKEFLSMLGVDGLINMFLADAGFGIDDFVKANKGDLMLAAMDFNWSSRAAAMGMSPMDSISMPQRPTAKIFFATSINDRPSFDKLVSVLTEKLGGGKNMGSQMMQHIPYTIKGNTFVTGTDSVGVFSFGATSTNHDFISKIKGHPMGAYIDIESMITGSIPAIASSDSVTTNIATESAKFWQDLYMYGGEFKGNSSEAYTEINLVDKTTNSLKQLNNYFGMIAMRIKAEDKKAREQEGIKLPSDTIVTVPAH
jgi:hypothetical protein